MNNTLPLNAVKRIIGKQGLRVSKDATLELTNELEDIGTTISERAIILSKHAGRKTVRKEDIKLASEQLTTE